MTSENEDPGPLPTHDEINVYDSLDERVACANFLGKNLDEAETLFRDNFLSFQEDLLFMGPRAFRFYVPAAIRYLLSMDSSRDSDAASSFAGLLEFRLVHERAEIAPIAGELADACQYLIDNVAKFDCEESIYGDVRARYQTLHGALEQLARAQS